ncbi:hypothetical protein NJLHNGOC_15380 [Novacetimonas cocois]|uniref:Uncharacterized protein n=1 Tax=Novacetimonas cocois TaxID=1747507 RepID=A0A365YP06_9PROT|nr:hypothetical protein NJLHNGOC_15380 [Novacetimonas cocois]
MQDFSFCSILRLTFLFRTKIPAFATFALAAGLSAVSMHGQNYLRLEWFFVRLTCSLMIVMIMIVHGPSLSALGPIDIQDFLFVAGMFH